MAKRLGQSREKHDAAIVIATEPVRCLVSQGLRDGWVPQLRDAHREANRTGHTGFSPPGGFSSRSHWNLEQDRLELLASGTK